MFYWVMKHLIAGPLLRALFRPRLIGRENIPATGGIVLASNHISFVDSVITPLVIKRRIHYLAASSYFTGRGVGGWALKHFLRGTGMIPLDRSGGSAAEASLRVGLRVLQQRQVLGIFPEGGRSRDGKLHRGRTGVARLILEAGVLVVPVGMIDTDKVMPPGSKSLVPHIQRIGISFGTPLDFSRYAGRAGDHGVLRAITDEIIAAIRELSGQEYVDSYGSSSSSASGASASDSTPSGAPA